ncbi:MAG: hypothetical protein RLY86_3256 [Pseudomonadota bacterium]|jgi:hypothetical protein
MKRKELKSQALVAIDPPPGPAVTEAIAPSAVLPPPKATGNIADMRTDPTFPKGAAVIHVTTENVELTGLDRKIFNYLLANAYPELENRQVFELSYRQLQQWVGSHESSDRIRSSLERLAEVRVTLNYLSGRGEERRQVGGIIYADTAKDGTGILRYEFPSLARPWIAKPAVYARLRLAVIAQFRGKYATTLYELMELRANLVQPSWQVDIQDFRRLLGVPDDKLTDFRAFRRRALEPAVEEINELSDLVITWDIIKDGRSVVGLTFDVSKKAERLAFEAELKHKAVRNPVGRLKATDVRDGATVDLIDGKTDDERGGPPALKAATYDEFSRRYPGLDCDAYIAEWRQAFAGKALPRDPDKAFLAWMGKIAEQGRLRMHGFG